MKPHRNDRPSLYWAFVSYSSKDRRWGEWLHRRLENYPIPLEFRGMEIFDGAVLGKNLRPVFRDRDELASSSDLGEAIHKALEASRFLVVLCSKNAAKSQWVNKEIEDFQAMGKGGRILALILDGEPNATAAGNPDEECFPPALRYPAEPIAGDLRKEGDGKERGFLKVLAGIAQLDFDKLYRRHERALARRRLTAGLSLALLVALFAAISTIALEQRAEAERQQDIAEKKELEKKEQVKESNRREARDKWLVLAKQATDKREFPHGPLYAARAIGFRGFGYEHLTPTLQEEFDLRYPVLVDPHEDKDISNAIQNVVYGKVRPLLPICFTQVNPDIKDIHCVDMSPDGRFLATGHGASDAPGSLIVWDLATGNRAMSVDSVEGGVKIVTYSPDGKTLVTAGFDHVIRVWNAESGEAKSEMRGHTEEIHDLKFSPDGARLVSSSSDCSVILWDMTALKKSAVLPTDGCVALGVVFSPDGTTLTVGTGIIATGIETSSALVFNLASEEIQKVVEGHDGWVRAVAVSPDGRMLASAGDDQKIKLWEIGNNTLRATLHGHHGQINEIAFSPDGNSLFSVGQDGFLIIWDVRYGRESQKASILAHGMAISGMAVSPDATALATASYDGAIRLWDVADSQSIATFGTDSGSFYSLAFANDDTLVIAGAGDSSVRSWSLVSGLQHYMYETAPTLADAPSEVAASSDGKILAVAYQSRVQSSLELVDLASDKQVRVLDTRKTNAKWRNLRFSPDNRLLFAVVGDDDSVECWDVAKGENVWRLPATGASILDLEVSPCGERFAVCTTDPEKLLVYDVKRPESVQVIEGDNNGFDSIAFSHEGQILARANGFSIVLWDITSQKSVAVLDCDGTYVDRMAFSPVGNLLAAAYADGEIRLWQVQSRKIRAVLIGQVGRIGSLLFNRSGTLLASASADPKTLGEVRVWNVAHDFSLDLAGYLAHRCYGFSEDGTLVPTMRKMNSSEVDSGVAMAFCNIGPWNYLSALHSSKPEPQRNADIFRHYVGNQAFGGALSLLHQPMDIDADASELAVFAARLHKPEKDYIAPQKKRAAFFFDRLRKTEWGRRHLSDSSAIDRLIIDTRAKGSLKEMLAAKVLEARSTAASSSKTPKPLPCANPRTPTGSATYR